jgi:hypothetical protein
MKEHLIENWLISSNARHFDFDRNQINPKSLRMFLNLLLATVTKRLDVLEQEVEIAEAMLLGIDKDLALFGNRLLQRFFKDLRLEEDLYIGYCDFLFFSVEKAIKSKTYSYLGELILSTDECKKWRKDIKEKSTEIDLIMGWQHPLSRDKIINGSQFLNSWAYASLFAGLAAKRLKTGNSDKAVHRLIQMGVLRIEEAYTRLACCKYLDSEYLELLEEIQQKLQDQVSR